MAMNTAITIRIPTVVHPRSAADYDVFRVWAEIETSRATQLAIADIITTAQLRRALTIRETDRFRDDIVPGGEVYFGHAPDFTGDLPWDAEEVELLPQRFLRVTTIARTSAPPPFVGT